MFITSAVSSAFNYIVFIPPYPAVITRFLVSYLAYKLPGARVLKQNTRNLALSDVITFVTTAATTIRSFSNRS